MPNWIKTSNVGEILFNSGIFGLGIIQIFRSEFIPFFIPDSDNLQTWMAPIWGVILILFAISNFLKKYVSYSGLALFAAMLFMAVCLQLPQLVINAPFWKDLMNLGAWTSFLKLLSFAGAFLFVDAHLKIYKNIGRTIFAVMLLIFGIDHLLYVSFISTLFPSWFPFTKFWTLLTGILLIASGLFLLLRIKVLEVAILTALMIFIWVWVIHLPLVILRPFENNGNEIISLFQALSFSGFAWMLAKDFSGQK